MKNIHDIFFRIKHILKSNDGESIAETMVSALIAVMALMIIAGAILTAARVNDTVEQQTLFINEGDAGSSASVTGAVVTIDASQTYSLGVSESTITAGKTVKAYRMTSDSRYLYYYE